MFRRITFGVGVGGLRIFEIRELIDRSFVTVFVTVDCVKKMVVANH